LKNIIKLVLIGFSITYLQFSHGYPQGLSEFVYLSGGASPFANAGQQIDYQTSCKVDNFPMLDKSVKCKPNGQLVIDHNFNDDNDRSLSVKGVLTGLFTLDGQKNMLLKLKNTSLNDEMICEHQGAYTLPIAQNNSDEMIQIAVNSLTYGYTLRLNIRGCELGHPKVIDFEVLDCSSSKCRASLKRPLIIWNRVEGVFN